MKIYYNPNNDTMYLLLHAYYGTYLLQYGASETDDNTFLMVNPEDAGYEYIGELE